MEEGIHEEDLWFREFGFFNNPCTIKPAPFDNKIFGQGKISEDISYLIPSGNMIFIEGPLGTGKTSLLHKVIEQNRGKKKVIFFSCNRIEHDLNIEELLRGRYGFWGRLFGLKPKNMIVLLDEAQDLSEANTERIKYFFDQGNIKSVIFTGTSFKEVNFHDSVKERIGSNILRMKELIEEEAVDLVRNRIGENELVSDEVIRRVFLLSSRNPRRMLQNLDRLCKEAVDRHENEVKIENIRRLTGIEAPLPPVTTIKKVTPLRRIRKR